MAKIEKFRKIWLKYQNTNGIIDCFDTFLFRSEYDTRKTVKGENGTYTTKLKLSIY
jgi:GTPase SAR1 family protein